MPSKRSRQSSSSSSSSSLSSLFSDPPPSPGRNYATPSLFSDSKVTRKIRSLVFSRENGQCWLCGLHGVHVAHIIARSDSILMSSYIAQGLLPNGPTLHSLPNLILLCAGCHYNFDVRIPIWTFLPTHLHAFVTDETAFQTRRAEAAARGIALKRKPRDILSPMTYTRYHIRSGFIRPAPFLETPRKRWSGDPISTILRSHGIISGIQRLPASEGGIPEETVATLLELLNLYSRVPPVPAGDPDMTVDMIDTGDEVESPPGAEHEGQHNSGQLPFTNQEQSTRSRQTSQHNTPDDSGNTKKPKTSSPNETSLSPATRKHHNDNNSSSISVSPPPPSQAPDSRNRKHHRRKHRRKQNWVLGPQFCANDIVKYRCAQ